MKEEEKAKNERGEELAKMRQQIAELEASNRATVRAIFQAFPDLCFWLEADGTIVDCNAGHTSCSAISPGLLPGKRMQDALPEEVAPRFQDALAQVLAVRSLISIEYLLPAPEGKRCYEARLMPFLEHEIIAVVRDITEQRRAQEEIKKLNEDLMRRAAELESTNTELKTFSYSVSHDLRTPLVVIAGFVRRLLEKYSNQLDAKGRQILETIHRNTQNMQELIDDLLMFCKVETQKLKPSEINTTEMVQAVFDELKELNPDRTLVLGTLPQIRGDRAMIRQVFFNLLSNACKFTRTKGNGTIEIGSLGDEDKVTFYVRDNGIGFDMHDAHKLFNVFQRLHSSDEFEGTGVGLAIVKRIISRHDGWVWAEGKVNEGATFYFGLPQAKKKTT